MKKRPEIVVAACISLSDGKILLVKSSRWGNYYLFPGGHIEYGETMVEAVKREAKEEIGLDVEVKEFLNYGELINSPAYHRKAHFIFFHFRYGFFFTVLKKQRDFVGIGPEA